MFLSILSFIAGLLTVGTSEYLSCDQAPDSLQAVRIVADRGVVVSRTDTVHISNCISITDALASLPCIYVMDYGGPAGLKNVSLRGMGSPHTAIYIDGVRVGNVQSGQADLGMLDLGNCTDIVIDYAQNSVSFNTQKPVFNKYGTFRNGYRPVGGKINFRGGSFGTYEPSARLDFRLSDSISLSATASGVLCKGDFPLQEGSRRLNNDIKQILTGLDLRGNLDGGNWHAKAFYSGARRGIPGTLDYPSTDRQNDCNAFIQGISRIRFTPIYHLCASAKLSLDKLQYLSEFGNKRYVQTEAQINSSHTFSVNNWFDTSLSADFQWDGLDSDLYSGARTSVFATLSTAFHPAGFKADISLEYAGIFERDGLKRNIISPSADIRWNIFKGFDIMAFARRAYRTPTFNELYYPGYGNPNLKAEDAILTGAGVEYTFSFNENWRIQTKADGFYNYLKNKIISAPTESNPNIWLPYNIGIVQMAGADVKADVKYTGGILRSVISARYCYQDATNRTPGSDTYGRGIPFISRHTVVLGADMTCRSWSATLCWNWRGGRYDSLGRMPDYNTLDLTAGKDFNIPGSLILGLKFHARNLTDCRYELSGGHPMPGRAFYGEINFKF